MSGLNVIEDNSLRATQSGFEVRLRYKWYRSLPLSCLENLEFSLDGQPVEASTISLGINGRRYGLDELGDRIDEFWFILDAAVLSVDQQGRVRSGESHTMGVAFGMRAPYIPIGPGRFLTIINKYSTTQVAA